jgi:hypothetical protein
VLQGLREFLDVDAEFVTASHRDLLPCWTSPVVAVSTALPVRLTVADGVFSNAIADQRCRYSLHADVEALSGRPPES